MQNGSGTRVCASGLGYNTAYAPIWYGVGCGGSGAVNVPWGNVLAYQKLHAYSINGYGGNINWH
ncbi:hypothetical protein [Subtercola sp. Z020]|uniref:hypothetical protein n=1 Tax=Subtercola sp. Z020 TaxID=2080582 RepID=UPI00130DB043|nr:hypothetical protein [Subtercola sp. Z020]